MKRIYLLTFFVQTLLIQAQAWPSENWSAATNLTAVMDGNGVTDLSGLHFNAVNNRLYAVQGDGHLRVLQRNSANNTFSQIAYKTLSGGPEGITQANLNANEFYTIDENNYEIRRYTHTANFSTVSLYKHWNLLASPSPMQDTGNNGCEGIVFIADSYLAAIGFISEQTGQAYTSVKGLGGLFFVASQDGGYIWVFDVNPNANDDFAYVGKYKTNRAESCELSFDNSTGLLYILHDIAGNNKLEVTNLSTFITGGGNRKFVTLNEFLLTNPGDANENIEGFAMTPKCSATETTSAWLCRDVENNEAAAIQQDALRWFNPFDAAGTCVPLETLGFEQDNVVVVSPNPATTQIAISMRTMRNVTMQICNSLGQCVLKNIISNGSLMLDISSLPKGIYILKVSDKERTATIKWIKN